jgi:rare lipoprotein A
VGAGGHENLVGAHLSHTELRPGETSACRWIWPVLAALALCVSIGPINPDRRVVPIPTRESAVAPIPESAYAPAVHMAELPTAQTSSTQGLAHLFDHHSHLIVAAVAFASAEVTGALPDRPANISTPKPVLRTPPALSAPSTCVPAVHVASLLSVTKCSTSQTFAGRFDYSDKSLTLNAPTNAVDARSVARLRFALSPPKPLVLKWPILPAQIEARIEQSGAPEPNAIVGMASMYNPTDPNDRDAGERQTASGELYDEAAWTAAIRIDLRGEFGGVGYGKNYQPAYALVEAGSKRAIVKINDVGPLAFGRIIDLNERTMRYFDPSLQLGLIHDMRVIPLPGRTWTAGPIDNPRLAGGFGM